MLHAWRYRRETMILQSTEEIFLKCDRVAASVVVQQYCSFVAIQFIFGQSSSFFVNPVSFGAAPKLTGLAKNEPDCQKRTVSPGQYRFTVLTTLFQTGRFSPLYICKHTLSVESMRRKKGFVGKVEL